jgi:hypothetical protein
MRSCLTKAATVLIVTASLFLSHSVPVQSQPNPGLEAPIGKVVSVTGSVTIEHAAAVVLQANLPSDSVQAKAGDFVYQADVIQTGSDGKVSITFTDGTAFNLSSNARLEVNEFLFNPNSQSNSSFFKLAKGTFTFVAGKVAKSGNMKIDTALATVGIRGTTPHVEVLEDGRVKFSTLIEDKDGVPTTSPGAARPRTIAPPPRARRAAAAPVPMTPEQASSYDRLFNVQPKLCRGC